MIMTPLPNYPPPKIAGTFEAPDMDIYLPEVQEIMFESIVPACCIHGCQVEPDGYCPHGQQSILLYYGLI